jgi:hypothetical protein
MRDGECWGWGSPRLSLRPAGHFFSERRLLASQRAGELPVLAREAGASAAQLLQVPPSFCKCRPVSAIGLPHPDRQIVRAWAGLGVVVDFGNLKFRAELGATADDDVAIFVLLGDRAVVPG